MVNVPAKIPLVTCRIWLKSLRIPSAVQIMSLTRMAANSEMPLVENSWISPKLLLCLVVSWDRGLTTCQNLLKENKGKAVVAYMKCDRSSFKLFFKVCGGVFTQLFSVGNQHEINWNRNSSLISHEEEQRLALRASGNFPIKMWVWGLGEYQWYH